MKCWKCEKRIKKDKDTKKYLNISEYFYNGKNYIFCSKKCMNTM